MAEAGGPESAAARCLDESSDSEPEQEPGSPQKLIRKVSTSGQIRSKTVLKEGNLLKQTNSFQRWKRRYFKLRGRTLYYAQTAKSIIFDEVDLTDASVAESSTKNVNNSFTVSMPHQWLEGNLPVSAKCNVCDKTCGSVLRLQDWRCLWCKAMVHSACKDQLSSKCPLGQCKVSVIPPTALNSIDSDGFWKASCPPSCTSPLLVFVNSKSGDNQGVKFLRRFKQLLNPAQVFDLMNGGPHLGLRLFQKFDTFRILVCGGDGSVGWVLSEIDALTLHKQCQLGVLPLGTGNDLARVLGWGSACDDDTQLPQILEKLERASTKMLDRWSIMVYETKFPRQHSASTVTEDCSDDSE
ncbi:Diacylglycerol kinase delta, partial [Larimichthys crocea]